MRLLLFDIDGTLLKTDGAGRRAVERALSDLLGEPVSTHGIRFSGKTDRQILREVITMVGGETACDESVIDECLRAYEAVMEATLHPGAVTAMPGAAALVQHLATEQDTVLGLVTGNIRRMAYRKLEAVHLAHFFPFGGFGCDAEDRNLLPGVAAKRAREHAGRTFDQRDVVVIGDTPRDVECAHAFGGRAVAVASGHFTLDELAASSPEVLLQDLSDLAECLAALR